MSALDVITCGPSAPRAVPISELGESHGLGGASWRMYQRFFGQVNVLLHEAAHREMLEAALCDLLRQRPGLADAEGLVVYAKTQTHTPLAEDDWLGACLQAAGIGHWEALTLSMTNCASALVAVHAFRGDGRHLIVLSGEKAFHRFGNRLSVGLLGEAPVAALFHHKGSHAVIGSHVRHLPRFHLNPDDMAQEDRQDLQAAFEAEFEVFVAECQEEYPRFFARKPVVVPYNLNTPLMHRVLARRGLTHQLAEWHSGSDGHTFCSDTFVNLLTFPVSPEAPVFLLCAGMGVTYAAVLLDPEWPPFSLPEPSHKGDYHVQS